MSQFTVQQGIELARQHMQAGRTPEAEAVYRQMAEAIGDNAAALYGLGMGAHQAGLAETSLQLLRRAVALQPAMAEGHNAIGMALRSSGKIAESLQAFQLAWAHQPENPEYFYNLVSAFRALSRGPDGVRSMEQLIARLREDDGSHLELGLALEGSGQRTEAIGNYRRAAALQPRFAPMWHVLGAALANARQFAAAIEAFERAAALEPRDARVHINLGHALQEVRQYQAAIEAFGKAIALRPADPHPHWQTGKLLLPAWLPQEAIAHFRRAIELDKNFAAVYPDLAVAVQNLGRADEAIPIHRVAIGLSPQNPVIHGNLLFAMHLSDTLDYDELLREHHRWRERFADPLASRIPVHGNDRSPDRALRIGYVSPDLRNHAVGTFFLPILEGHDRRQFHITCYANSWMEDEVTARMRAAAGAWHTTADWSDDRLAAQIVRDRIDILVDLAQHTAGNRILIFAARPAPVQVTYLGFPGTTGLKTFDARLGDPWIDPPGQTERFYTEPIARLPETYWCLSPIADAPPVGALPATAAGSITFGCLNKLAKSSPSALRAWSRILRRVPGSRLLLSAPPGDHRQRIIDIFKNEAVDPLRIEFIPKQPFADYLALYNRIDIALDPFPYAGGTTTCHALWMGIPVVTLAGIAGVQRSGASLLSNAGLTDMIANTAEQYIQIAVDLAGDLPRLASLRAALRERMTASPLMNVPRFVGNLEAIYRRLWMQWCDWGLSKAVI